MHGTLFVIIFHLNTATNDTFMTDDDIGMLTIIPPDTYEGVWMRGCKCRYVNNNDDDATLVLWRKEMTD